MTFNDILKKIKRISKKDLTNNALRGIMDIESEVNQLVELTEKILALITSIVSLATAIVAYRASKRGK